MFGSYNGMVSYATGFMSAYVHSQFNSTVWHIWTWNWLDILDDTYKLKKLHLLLYSKPKLHHKVHEEVKILRLIIIVNIHDRHRVAAPN
jgi:hypothetical protein